MKNLTFLILFFCVPVLAQNDSLFNKANNAYNQGDYKSAIEDYTQILKNGETSAALYYNLANANYKTNHIAQSVYYYEKALQLKPGDADIQNNLAFAQNMVIDDIKSVPESGVSKMFNNIIGVWGYNGWAWSAIICCFIFGIVFLLYYFSIVPRQKRIFFSVSILALVLAIFSTVFAFHQKSTIDNNLYAIVFSKEVPVRSEPNARSDEAFTLHEGTKVEVTSSFQGWTEIKLANGSEGWVQASQIKKL
ncbi:MAG: tetratricopeptide repeat protein [Gillisia sp.]